MVALSLLEVARKGGLEAARRYTYTLFTSTYTYVAASHSTTTLQGRSRTVQKGTPSSHQLPKLELHLLGLLSQAGLTTEGSKGAISSPPASRAGTDGPAHTVLMAMIDSATATSPSSSPHRPGHAHVASTGWFDIARRALLAAVATVASGGLLNTGPEVNAATDGADDSGSSVDQEEAGGTSPSHVLLFLPNWELLTAPFPEDASFTAPLQEASQPMTSSPLPQVGVQSSLVRPPGKLEFKRESIIDVQSSLVRPPGKLEFKRESIIDVQSSMVRPPGKLDFKRESIIDVVTEARPAQHVRPLLGCNKLPLRDNKLLPFLVKASELLANGALVLSFGGFAAAYYSKQDLGGMAKLVHETLGGKICFIFVNFVMYWYTVWVSSMAKAAEQNRSDLGKLSVQVIVIFSYLVLLGAFMMQCVTGAAIWEIAPGVAIVIAIMLVTWGRAFSRPMILRRLLYCWGYFGTDPAAAQTTVDDRLTQECNDSSSSARTAFAAQLTSEDKAARAKVRAEEASEIQAKAVQELAVAKNRSEKAWSDLKKARKRVSNDDEADAGSSAQLLCEARYACAAALKARADATRRAQKAADDACKKMREFRAADEEAKSAVTDAQAKYERAETAKKFWEL